MSFASFAVIWLGFNLLFGTLSAYVASRWGRDPFGWLLLGAVLGPLGFLLLVAMHADDARRSRHLLAERAVERGARAGLRVLVPTDGSIGSAKAVQYVVERLRNTLGEVTVISVLPMEMANGTTKPEASPRRQRLEEEIQGHLGATSATLRAAGITCTQMVRFGDPADEIVRLAGEGGFDMIVMGRRGRGPVARLLLGSVCEKVIRSASCAVTVVG